MPELALPGATLAYRQSGAGPDVVWLAAGDNPGDNWRRFQTPAFDDRYRSTTYDARGVGANAGPLAASQCPRSRERLDPQPHALAQARRQARLDDAPHLLRVVARAEVRADDDLILGFLLHPCAALRFRGNI